MKSQDREKRRKKSQQGVKGKVGRPKKSVKTIEESDDDLLMGEEIEADGDKFFEEAMEEVNDQGREVSWIVEDGDGDGEDDGKSHMNEEISLYQGEDLNVSKETSSHSHPSLQTHLPQIVKTPEPRLLSPPNDSKSVVREEADLVDLDDLYSWETQ